MKTSVLVPIFACAVLGSVSLMTNAAQWTLDNANSNIGFTTQGVGGTNAKFSQMQGTATFDPNNLKDAKINLKVNASSLSAGLKTSLYKGSKGLDVSKFPTLTFTSTSITPISGNRYKMNGMLSMHGVTKPTSWILNVNPQQNTLSLSASTKIDRTQWGMTSFENLIDETIQLSAKTQFNKAS